MQGTACFDPSGTYRYHLSRTWDEALPVMAFVMLNPSRADDSCNDPTIRRCITLAQQWGYGGLAVVNLFAYCAAHPKVLWQTPDPVGPENDPHLLRTCGQAERILLAWGNWGSQLGRDRTVLTLLAPHWARCCCLGLNQTGLPRHPLYVRRDSQPLPWVTTIDAAAAP